ncbi:MAG: threonylcarbamoyl-AMP synthase [Erysipelotrichaceae bacterium]|jgi:L-threonylcarbamoyladenylate synthase|nr:threonylcarbamoyl-AMP synthase [Erysipelotrichaceae bacterium]
MPIINENNLELIVTALSGGEVVAMPADTVFGFYALYDQIGAFNNLNSLKRRKPDTPYGIIVNHLDDIKELAVVNDQTMKFLNKFITGPLTVILKSKDSVPPHVTLNTGKIGIRLANTPLLKNILEIIKKPLLQTSANISGEKPIVTTDDLSKIFGKNLLIVEGSPKLGQASAIIDMSEGFKLIRHGVVDFNVYKTYWENL